MLTFLFGVFAHAASCVSELSVERAFLYRATRGGRTSHLLGSRHFGVPLRAMPERVRETIAQAEVVVFETRPRVRPPRPWATRLSEVLSLGAWTELVERLGAKGLPETVVDGLSPALAYFLLDVDPEAFTRGRLDDEIRAEARARGAHVGALETADAQERLLDELVDARELETALLSPGVGVDHSFFLTGDERAGERALARLASEHPRAYRRLVVERNEAWLKKIEGAHRRPGRVLIVVGALHLGGADGLLARLKARGFTVERVD